MNKFKNCLRVPAVTRGGSFALLFARVVMGVAFMFHGWSKIQNPFGWMPAEAGVPGILQSLAALSEFGGGFALILGLLTPLATLGIAFTMAVATFMHAVVMGDPFVAGGAGQSSYELALIYLAFSVLFMLVGPGGYSADAKIFGKR